MIPILAAATDATEISTNALTLAGVALLVNLAIGLFTLLKFANGRSGERQIEPTAISSLQVEMKTQTGLLSTLSREMGEVRTIGNNTSDAITELRSKLSADVGGVHRRIDTLAESVAEHKARIGSLERESAHHRHANPPVFP